jgi:hypothetical protein
MLFDQAGITGTSAAVGGFPLDMKIYWHVNAENPSGSSIWSATWSMVTELSEVLAQKDAELSKQFSMTSTGIRYSLLFVSKVSLSLYDMQGKLINRLSDDLQSAGQHFLSFSRAGAKTGCYVLEFRAGDLLVRRKMMIVR